MKQRISRRRFGLRKRLLLLSSTNDRPGPCPSLAALVRAYGDGGAAPEVLFLGDSSSMNVSWDDWSQQPVTRALARRVRPRRVCTITQFGYHLGVYAGVVQVLGTLPKRPDLVLFPINLRQFSPQWLGNPNLAFTADIEALHARAADPGVGVPVVPPFPRRIPWMQTSLDAAAWQRHVDTPVSLPGRAERTVADYIATTFSQPATPEAVEDRLRALYAFHYTGPVDDEHPRVQDLRTIGALAPELGCEIAAWVNPINRERGRELLGSHFDDEADRRVAICRDALGPVPLHDLSALLGAGDFFDSVEHYDEHGRRRLTDALVQVIAAPAGVRRGGHWARPLSPAAARQPT